MALENIAENQGCAIGKVSNAFKCESKAVDKVGKKDNKPHSQITDPPSNHVHSIHDEGTAHTLLESQIDAQSRSSESSENACTRRSEDVNKSLSQCYEMLRGQIVEVAERMEGLVLTLKGDVQRLTSDMQTRLTRLERQALHLEQIFPSKKLKGQQTLSSFTQKSYERNFLLQTQNDGSRPLFETRDNDNIQPKIGGLPNHEEQLSTEKLIASVKARCIKTKELLMDSERHGAYMIT